MKTLTGITGLLAVIAFFAGFWAHHQFMVAFMMGILTLTSILQERDEKQWKQSGNNPCSEASSRKSER